jgi:hypothetical protein
MRKFLRPLDVTDLARPLLDTGVKLSCLLIFLSLRALRLLDGISDI